MQVFAQSPKEAYEKAYKYEKDGNISEAMKWYKKSANLAITNEKESLKVIESLPFYAKEEAKSYEKTQQSYKKHIREFDSNETEQTVGQMLTGMFGIKPYNTNYLMPVVYDKSSRKDRKHLESQFQISFKRTMFSNLLGFDEQYVFGYTQTSWWQTFKHSMPFRETNYRPEVFIQGFYGDKNVALKGYKFGFLHESDGRDSNQSRSWNRLYLSTYWQIGNVFLTPRIWYRISEPKKKNPEDYKGDDNPDIQDYLGYGDLTITYPWRRHVFQAKIRNNLKFNSKNRGSFEFEWTFPLWSKNFFGYLNYFTGYGRSIEDYDSHSDRIGLGFAISR